VLAIEAVRVFLPDVFKCLHAAVQGLTTTVGLHGQRGDEQLKRQVDTLIASGEKYPEIIRSIMRRLFPASQRHVGGSHYADDWKSEWLKGRRLAHEDILRLYLERVEGEGLRAFTDAERAWGCFTDRYALDAFLRTLDRDRLQDVIASLEHYESQFGPSHVVPGTIVLLNLQSDIPKRERSMFEFDSRFAVGRVTLRLLRSLQDPLAVETAVRQILPELTSLSSKFELISQVGHRQDVGHKLVPASAAAELERAWRDELRFAEAQRLIAEWDLARILLLAKRDADPSEDKLTIDASPEMTLALLLSVWTQQRSQSLGSRAVRQSPRLAWDVLIELYGDEPKLRERIAGLKSTNPMGVEELLALADRYLSGWRPNMFDDD
jgi:hypothetical protein